MKTPLLRRAAMALLALSAALPAATLPVQAREKQFPALVHLRHPDGREEVVTVANLRFVYYDRRFIRHSTGFGKPADLEIRDLPREVRSIQDEERSRLRFSKIRDVVFLYREENGRRLLRLVATRISRRRKPEDWPGGYLRNANMSLLPHFRGRVGDRDVDFPLPPLVEPVRFSGPVLTQIEIQAPVRVRRP